MDVNPPDKYNFKAGFKSRGQGMQYIAGERNVDMLIPKLSVAFIADMVDVLGMCLYPWFNSTALPNCFSFEQ